MFKIRKSSISLILLFFFLQACAGSSGTAVSRVQVQEAPPSGWYWDESRKALAYGGGGKAEKGKENKKETLPPSVKEITPPISAERTYSPEINFKFSKKDYIRGRFPGKRVIFPDEIKVPEKRPDYKVGVEDVLSVLVWNNPDLSIPSVVVRRDGMISQRPVHHQG